MRTQLIIIILSLASIIITGQDLIVDNKVGIGTTVPFAPLHIKGNNEALIIEGTQPWLSFYNGATRNGYLQHDAANMWLVNEKLGNLFFRTNNITRMTINSTGSILIGTSILGAKLNVQSTTGEKAIRGESASGIGVHGSSDSGIGVFGFSSTNHGVKGQSTSQTGVWGEGTSGIGVVGRSISNVGVKGDSDDPDKFDFIATTSDGSNGYGETSSIRWKTDVRNIDNPIIKLSQLRGVYFNWKEEFGGNNAIGFIAEEVGKVLPEIVVYEENGIDAVGLDYGKMTPLLVEAANAMRKEYQEKFDHQQSNISRQQSEIDALKQDMAELKSHLKAQLKNASED